MSDNWKAFLLWTGIVLVVYVISGTLVARDTVHSNFDDPFATGQNMMVVGSKPIQFEAASSNFFILRPESGGESILGEYVPPPLGWESKTYFVASGELETGKWIFEKGSATFRIKSEGPVTITELVDKAHVLVLLLLTAICIWMVGIAIVHL